MYDRIKGLSQNGKSVSASTIRVVLVRQSCHNTAMRFLRRNWL